MGGILFEPVRPANVAARKNNRGQEAVKRGIVRDGQPRTRSRVANESKKTYRADEARVVPAVAQSFQEAVAGIDLKVTAMTFSTEHLFIVWRGKTNNKQNAD